MTSCEWTQPCGCRIEMDTEHFGRLYPCPACGVDLARRDAAVARGEFVASGEFFRYLREKVRADRALRPPSWWRRLLAHLRSPLA